MVRRAVPLSFFVLFPCILSLLFLFPPEGSARDLHGNKGPGPQKSTRLEIPPGWTVSRGQQGLIVPHPAGWEVRERGGGAFVAFRPGAEGGAESILCVRPIEKIEGKSTGVVQGLGQIEPDLFPGVKMGKSRVLSSKPEVAVAGFTYSPRAGLSFRGVAMCFNQQGKGVLYAIASRSDAWPREEPVMKRMLGAFFYSGSGGPAGEGGPGDRSSLPPMVEWRDPAEAAFTVPVPKGWTVEGGLLRFGASDVQTEVVVTSPDRQVVVRLGDSTIPSFDLPTQFGASIGMYEGTGSARRLILRYLPSTVFLTEFYLPRRVGPIRTVQARDFPEISMAVAAQRQRAGMPSRVDTGEITFEADGEDGPRNGYAFCQTIFMPSPGVPDGGFWSVTQLNGYMATRSAEPAARAVLSRMVLGVRWNPIWQAQQSRTNARVAQINRRSNEEISAIINRAWEEKSRSWDNSREKWTQAYRGQVRIEDPATGERFDVPSGSNYYWSTGGDIIGTRTSDPPTHPNHWVKEMRIVE